MTFKKYDKIYKDIKEKIENNTYKYSELLPSEHNFIEIYDCSRNTVRRALTKLSQEGYIHTIQGVGVRVIYSPSTKTSFTIGEIETFSESAKRNKQKSKTKVILFTELIIDETLAQQTGFNVNDVVYYIQRVHYLDEKALILNHNYFLKSVVGYLDKKIASKSIYKYLETVSNISIVNSKRIMTVEKITQIDEKYLNINPDNYNCLAVISSNTFDKNGNMFEFTQSRHIPEYFRFSDNAIRK